MNNKVASVYTLDGDRISVLPDRWLAFSLLEKEGETYIAYEEKGVYDVSYDDTTDLFMYKGGIGGWSPTYKGSIADRLYTHQLFSSLEDGPIIGITTEAFKDLCVSYTTGDSTYKYELVSIIKQALGEINND